MTCPSAVRLAAALILSAAFCQAAPFEPALVSSKAKFVAFIDFDRARTTAAGKRVIDYVRENPRYAEIEAKLIEHVGLMPLSDVHDVTLWGEQHAKEPKAVLVVRATFNAKSLRFAAGFTPGFDLEDYHGQELLSWADENKPGGRVYACIDGSDTVLFGNDAATVKRGIDVLTDDKESLKPDAALPKPVDTDTWAFASAIDFAGTPDAANHPVARELHDAILELGETADAKTTLRLTGTTSTDAAGPRLTQMAGGAVLLAQLGTARAAPTTAPDGPKDPRAEIAAMVPELLRAVRVSGSGRSVRIDLAVDNATAVTLLGKVAEVRDADAAAAEK